MDDHEILDEFKSCLQWASFHRAADGPSEEHLARPHVERAAKIYRDNPEMSAMFLHVFKLTDPMVSWDSIKEQS